MTGPEERLNLVDEKGNIIGEETRENIHIKGLLHREVHVWLYTPGGGIIFQHRGSDKETFPNLLDASIGGHVGMGKDYEMAALQEAEEETGMKLDKGKLVLAKTSRVRAYDSLKNKINNVLRATYIYPYEGEVRDLRIEEGEAVGFEVWPLEKFMNPPEEEKQRVIPGLLEEAGVEIAEKVKELIAS